MPFIAAFSFSNNRFKNFAQYLGLNGHQMNFVHA
jgi:hypothetical protein